MKKLDKSRHYGLLFVEAEVIYVQDGIKFSPKTEKPIKEKEEKEEEKEVKTEEPIDEKKEDVIAKEEKKEIKAKGFVCKKCGKVCTSKAGLSAHSRYCKK